MLIRRPLFLCQVPAICMKIRGTSPSPPPPPDVTPSRRGGGGLGVVQGVVICIREGDAGVKKEKKRRSTGMEEKE